METTIAPRGFFFIMVMMKWSISDASNYSQLPLSLSYKRRENALTLLYEKDKPICKAFDVFRNVNFSLTENGDYGLIPLQTNGKKNVKFKKDEMKYLNYGLHHKNDVIYERIGDRHHCSRNKSKINMQQNQTRNALIRKLKKIRTQRIKTEYQTKLQIKTDKFIADNFPTSYMEVDLLYQEDIQLKEDLNHIENIVNQAANTKRGSILNDALLRLKGLLVTNGGTSPRTLVQFADALTLSYYLNNFDENIIIHAIDTYTKVLISYSDSETLCRIVAKKCVDVLRGLKWYSQAITFQKNLLAMFPNYEFEGLNIMGSIFLEMGNSKEAENTFNRSLQLNPENNGFAKINLGYLLYFEILERFSVIEGPNVIDKSWKQLLQPCIDMLQTGMRKIQFII